MAVFVRLQKYQIAFYGRLFPGVVIFMQFSVIAQKCVQSGFNPVIWKRREQGEILFYLVKVDCHGLPPDTVTIA